jgi:chromosome partitioning protein
MEKKYIVFGNQKGGSGKSTLCAMFGNFLAMKGKKLALADFDYQGSLVQARKIDLASHPDKPVLYKVQGFQISLKGDHTIEENFDHVNNCLDKIAEGVDVIVVDTPGNLNEDTLLCIFQRADVAITPFGYDTTSWESLKLYRKFLRLMKQDKIETPDHQLIDNPYKAHFDLFFILNKFDSRIGKAIEHELWSDMDLILSNEGTLAPPIKYLATMMHINTLYFEKGQLEAVQNCFQFIYRQIFNEI